MSNSIELSSCVRSYEFVSCLNWIKLFTVREREGSFQDEGQGQQNQRV